MKPLPIYVDYLVAAAALIAGAMYGRRLFSHGVRLDSRGLGRRAPLLVVAGLTFILGNTLYFVGRSFRGIEWYFPVAISYSDTAVLWLLNLAVMVFAGVAAGYVAVFERHRARYILAASILFCLMAGPPLYHAYSRPVPPALRAPRVTVSGMLLQTSGSSCSAVSCANVAGVLGAPKTEQEMVDLLGTTVDGTTSAQIVYGMRRLGFRCLKRCIRDRDVTRLHPPALLQTDLVGGVDGHTVAYMGLDGDGVPVVWDPMSEETRRSKDDLQRVWQGRAIEVYKAE